MGTGGVFFDACRLQELRARAGTPNQNRYFINFGICSMALRRVLAAAGALFSLWRLVANNGYFGLHCGVILGAQSSTILTLGSQMGCRFKGDFLRISRGRQDSEDVLGGR